MSHRLAPQSAWAIGVLGALAIIAVVTAREPVPADTAYASTDYRADGYRAWSTLMAREGVTTTRFVLRPIELDGRIDTLVSAQPPPLETDPSARTAADLGALASWVRAGGQLVYIGRNALLGEAETGLLALPFLLPDVGARGGLRGPDAASVGSLHALGTNRMLLVEHPGHSDLADGNGDIVVRYRLGRGAIVAVIDPVLFTNEAISRAGNARLAFLIARPRRAGGIVAFDDGVHGALIDRPWYRALPLPLRIGLGGVAFALLLGLIGAALPGRPPMALQPAREPTSMEFIAALAALYARTKARVITRERLAADALATAARSVGLADDAPPALLLQRIGDGSGAAAVRRLLDALEAPPSTDADLIAGAQLAYHVRRELRHGGNRDGRRAAFAGRSRPRRRWE